MATDARYLLSVSQTSINKSERFTDHENVYALNVDKKKNTIRRKALLTCMSIPICPMKTTLSIMLLSNCSGEEVSVAREEGLARARHSSGTEKFHRPRSSSLKKLMAGFIRRRFSILLILHLLSVSCFCCSMLYRKHLKSE